ncbi:hypothetical protein O6H91_02G060800 [Diphasiastrum complanatum]|uniref:Uncharacterized protein n=1 Tax=Diphasiastrum complanatum TaxID=34168 RepID=A0ACC2EGD1_DIPCM|nr:hypothetical protein O6H91_02G060800 [Diphasiastrum complanatum]
MPYGTRKEEIFERLPIGVTPYHRRCSAEEIATDNKRREYNTSTRSDYGKNRSLIPTELDSERHASKAAWLICTQSVNYVQGPHINDECQNITGIRSCSTSVQA